MGRPHARAAALLAVLCAACSPPGRSENGNISFATDNVDRVTQAFPAPEGVSVVSWLLDGDGDWAFEITFKSNELTRDCMIARGYAAYPVSSPPKQGEAPLTRPLPALSVEQAASSGYAIVEGEDAAWVDPVTAYFSSLSAREQPAFQVAVSECAELVRAELFSGAFDQYEEARQLLEAKMISLFDDFYASDEVRDVFAEWSRCMNTRGFDAETPFDSMQKAAEVDKALERQIASADAQCRSELTTEQAIAKLFRAAESNFLVENEPLLLEVLTLSGREVPQSG